LMALPEKMRGPIMRDALQAGGDVMLSAMQDSASAAFKGSQERTPDSNALDPGMVEADLHTQIQEGKGDFPPRIKVGPSSITGRVVRWQNDGYNLTTHGKSRASRKVIKAIPGKHFIEAAFDESCEAAVQVFLDTLVVGVFGDENDRPVNLSRDVEFG